MKLGSPIINTPSIPDGPNHAVPEAARILGWSVHTVRAWVARRKIGYYKIGRSVRIPDAEIRKLLEAGYVPPRLTRDER